MKNGKILNIQFYFNSTYTNLITVWSCAAVMAPQNCTWAQDFIFIPLHKNYKTKKNLEAN